MWSDGPCGTGLPDGFDTLNGVGPETAPAGPRQPGRLAAWSALVGVLVVVGYASRLADVDVPDDLLYRWSTFVGALIQYAVMLVLILAISQGLDRRLLALDLPTEPWRAVGRALIALVFIVVVAGVLSRFLDAGGEQGLVPEDWDSSRAAPFLANAAAVTIAAPLVEELLFRGLGYTLLTRFVGPFPAIAITGVAFGLAHGLVVGLPVLAAFGVALGWLRWQTGSVIPGIVVHALFNAAALAAAVAL